MSHSLNNEDPEHEPLQRYLSNWKSSLSCSDEEAHRMWKVVWTKLETSPVAPLDTAVSWNVGCLQRLWPSWSKLVPLLALLMIATGIGVKILLRDHAQSDGPRVALFDSLEQFAFTTQELKEDRIFACEVSRLCERPVLVCRRSASFEIDGDPYVADATSQVDSQNKVLIRCVLLEKPDSAIANAEWREIRRDEVIGGKEQQFQCLWDSNLSLNYWSHLLPDESLWAEVGAEPNAILDNSVDHQRQILQPNVPKIVWEDHREDVGRKLVMVFELLGQCDTESLM